MSVEVVVTGVKCSLGEGPHWEVDKEALIYLDSVNGDIMRWTPDTKRRETIHLDNKIGSVVPCEAGGYLIGLGRTIAHVNWETQQVTKQYLVESVGADDRFNDGKCDSRGRFWTGTMGKRISNLPTYERHVGALYSLNLEGILNRHLDKLDISNGLSWSADNRTMFYTDTVPRKIYAFDYDINLGTISSQRVAVDMAKFRETKTMGYPDGMTIDTNDHLWVTCFGFGKVICFDPNTGQQIRTVTVPVRRSTSCCFGGKGLDELYVTSASEYATEQELQGYPDSGSLFKITGLGVKGHPANVYRGKLQKQKL